MKITDYLPLVKSIAKKYVQFGVDYEDLVQQGSLGLIESAKRFNPRQGPNFATYSRFWIKKYILELVNKEIKNSKVNNVEKEKSQRRKENSDNLNSSILASNKIEMKKALEKLDPLEREIFELSCIKRVPLNKISKELGITRERARQYRQKAKRRLKLTKKTQ